MKTYASIAAILLIACSCTHKVGKDDASTVTPTVEVSVPIIDSVTLHKTYPGYLTASTHAEVVARANGVIESINFTGGQKVTKGQVLFVLDNPKYKDDVKQAQAQLTNAQAQYEYAVEHLAALKKAYQAEAVSRMDVVSAENDLRQAEAAVSTAEAALSTARTNLSYLTVRAPISGTVSDNLLSLGNYVAGEGEPVTLTTVYDNSRLTATFSIEDTQFESLIAGGDGTEAPLYRAVPINFSTPMQHEYATDLYYTAPSVSESTGSLEIKGHIDNPYGELRDGMYVNIDMPYGTDLHAILVRDASISTDQLGKYLYVVNDSNTVVYTPIKVGGLYQDSLRLVTSGLRPDDRYVTSALLSVRPGMKVEPKLSK